MNIWNKAFAFGALVLGISGQAMAGIIISGDGDETCSPGSPISASFPTCSAQLISVHSAWQSNNPNGNGAAWISYADTGVNGSTLAPPSGNTVVMTITETFFANTGDKLYLDVWADDTAEVLINGVSVFSPNFTQSTCANGAIGCEPGENAMIYYTFTSAGTQTIDFDVFQVGTGTSNSTNPFGLLYSGQLETPEPLSIILLGFGLAGLGLTRRRM